MDKKVLGQLASVLLIVGGLNWGLVGILDFDAVATIFGAGTIAKAVYVLVGLSAVYSLLGGKKK